MTSQLSTTLTFFPGNAQAHKIILKMRSDVFARLLSSNMRDSQEGFSTIEDIQPDVFRALLTYVYTDKLPEELQGAEQMHVSAGSYI